MTRDELEACALPQRKPIPNDGPAVVVAAAAHVRAVLPVDRDGRELGRILRLRSAIGRREYGVELQAHNGRSPAIDALQEALDLLMYAKQGELEARDLGLKGEALDWHLLASDAARAAQRALYLRREELRRSRRPAPPRGAR